VTRPPPLAGKQKNNKVKNTKKYEKPKMFTTMLATLLPRNEVNAFPIADNKK